MKRIWIPQTVAMLMLIIALSPSNPYGYYILMRWVLCPLFAYLALQALSKGNLSSESTFLAKSGLLSMYLQSLSQRCLLQSSRKAHTHKGKEANEKLLGFRGCESFRFLL
jgi:hypothetical protein